MTLQMRCKRSNTQLDNMHFASGGGSHYSASAHLLFDFSELLNSHL